MKAKIIIILVLLAIAGFVLFSMSPDQNKQKDAPDAPSPDGTGSDPYKAIVTQMTWEPGQPAPDGWQIVTDTRTGGQTIRPISTR